MFYPRFAQLTFLAASVDYETDRNIQDTIAYEFKDKTILCIARMLLFDMLDLLLTWFRHRSASHNYFLRQDLCPRCWADCSKSVKLSQHTAAERD